MHQNKYEDETEQFIYTRIDPSKLRTESKTQSSSYSQIIPSLLSQTWSFRKSFQTWDFKLKR